MKTTIKVTARHIKRGWRYSTYSCPVALAATLRKSRPASVQEGYINWGNGLFALLPDRIDRKIANYDRTGRMKPFQFTVDVPRDAK